MKRLCIAYAILAGVLIVPMKAAENVEASQGKLFNTLKEQSKEALGIRDALQTEENKALATEKMRPLRALIVRSKKKVLTESHVEKADALLKKLRIMQQQELREQWAEDDKRAEEEKASELAQEQRMRAETARIMQEIDPDIKAEAASLNVLEEQDVERAIELSMQEQQSIEQERKGRSRDPNIAHLQDQTMQIYKRLERTFGASSEKVVKARLFVKDIKQLADKSNPTQDDLALAQAAVNGIQRLAQMSDEEDKEYEQQQEESYLSAEQNIATLRADQARRDQQQEEAKQVLSAKKTKELAPAELAQDLKQMMSGFSPDVASLIGEQLDITWSMPDLKMGEDIQVQELKDAAYKYACNVVSIAISEDDQIIVLGVEQGRVQVWSSRDGTLLRTIVTKKIINRVIISKDKEYILIGGQDGVEIWRLSDGQLVQQLGDLVGYVDAVAISADNSYIVASTNDGEVGIWKDRQLIKKFDNTFLSAIEISPDATYFVAGMTYYDKDFSHGHGNWGPGAWRYKAEVYGIDGELRRTLDGEGGGRISSIKIDSENGTVTTAAPDDRMIRTWRLSDGTSIQTSVLNPGSDRFNTVAIGPDQYVIVGDYQNIMIDDRNGNRLKWLYKEKMHFNSVAMSHNKDFVVGGGHWDACIYRLISSQSVMSTARKTPKIREVNPGLATLNNDLLNAIIRLAGLERDLLRSQQDIQGPVTRLDKRMVEKMADKLPEMAKKLPLGLPQVQEMLSYLRGVLKGIEDTRAGKEKEIYDEINRSVGRVGDGDDQLKKMISSALSELSSGDHTLASVRAFMESLLMTSSPDDQNEVRAIINMLDRLEEIKQEREAKGTPSQQLGSIAELLTQLEKLHQKIPKKSALIIRLMEEGADPRAQMPDVNGSMRSIVQKAVDSLGRGHPIIRSLQEGELAKEWSTQAPVWLHEALRFVTYLYDESIINPGEYTPEQQQKLLDILQAVKEMVNSKKEHSGGDLLFIRGQMERARDIYLSAPTRRDRIVNIPN